MAFKILCAHIHIALKNMGDEFLTGYVNLAEGEKDPRNLLVAFAIARVLLIEFDTKHHVEVRIVFPVLGLTRETDTQAVATLQHYILLFPDHLPATTR